MDFKEIKKKTDNELKRILAEERGKLYDLRLRLSINQLKDVSRVKSIRANIARILMQLAKPKEESAVKNLSQTRLSKSLPGIKQLKNK